MNAGALALFGRDAELVVDVLRRENVGKTMSARPRGQSVSMRALRERGAPCCERDPVMVQ
jgi:hypothetical protein